MNSIVNRIKELREENNLSQTKMAAEIAVKRHHVVDIESEKQRPPYETILKYADYFNVNMEWLMKGEGEKYAKADKVTEPVANYGAGILENMAKNENELKAKVDLLISLVTNLSQESKELRQEIKALKDERTKGAEFVPANRFNKDTLHASA